MGTMMADTTHFNAYLLCYTHIPRLCTLDANGRPFIDLQRMVIERLIGN